MPKELTADNFSLKQKVLTCATGVSGSTIIFFKKQGCNGCLQVAPIFNQLEQEYGNRIQFAAVDVAKHKRVGIMAKNSTTQINYVPFIMVYVGNLPRIKFTGNPSLVSLRNFIDTALPDMRNPQYPPQNTGNYQQQPAFTQLNQSDLSQQSRRGGGRAGGYMMLGGPEDRDDGCTTLMCPNDVNPHNSPWKTEYRRMELELNNRG
jgi:thiol-disulfide isomerase/thioredoxin